MAQLLRLLSFLLLVQNNAAQNNCGVSRRRPWRSLSCAEQEAYLDAIQEMKDSGIYDEITRVHFLSGEDNHFLNTFLPFHRWLIWVFERELQRFGGCDMTIPYWDWENGSRSQVTAWVLQANSFGTRRPGCVPNGIAANWWVENGDGCLWRDFLDIDFSRDVEVLNRITNAPRYGDFAPSLEGAPHTSVHDYIGGPMEGFWAPDDPLFHLHHSNVDRIYSLWQDYHNYDLLNPENHNQRHYVGDLDRPLRIQQGRRVNFNSPNTGRPPTPRELMHNRGGILEVQYVDDNLARTLIQTDGDYDNNNEWHSAGNAPTRGCPPGGGGGDGGAGGGGGGGNQDGNRIQVVGNDGVPDFSFPLGECEGDCDNDGECRGSLVCFDRNANEPVPGCVGGEFHDGLNDFCISPSDNNDDGDDNNDGGGDDNNGGGDDNNNNDNNSNGTGNQVRFTGNDGFPPSAFPLGECEGDCDNDSHCRGNLVCYTRNMNEAVPGCDGGEMYDGNEDFCISPSNNNNNDDDDDDDDNNDDGDNDNNGGGNNNGGNGIRLQRVGNDGIPSSAFPLGECEGDCDRDSACWGNLVCFRRRPNQVVPGCVGGEWDTSDTDYCISPNLRRVLNFDFDEDLMELAATANHGAVRQSQDEDYTFLSSKKLQARWLELRELYKDDAARIFEILSREDCEERDREHPGQSATLALIQSRNMTEQEVQMLACHYVHVNEPS